MIKGNLGSAFMSGLGFPFLYDLGRRKAHVGSENYKNVGQAGPGKWPV